MAALEKYSRLCGLAVPLFSYISGGWKSEIKWLSSDMIISLCTHSQYIFVSKFPLLISIPVRMN